MKKERAELLRWILLSGSKKNNPVIVQSAIKGQGYALKSVLLPEEEIKKGMQQRLEEKKQRLKQKEVMHTIGFSCFADELSDQAKEMLEKEGFVVVGGAKTTEPEAENVKKFDLVLDTQEPCTEGLLDIIFQQYYSKYQKVLDTATDVLIPYPKGEFVEGTTENLQKILQQIGYEVYLDGESPVRIARSSIQRPVKESKIREIYEGAKTNMAKVVEGLKALTKGEDKKEKNEIDK